MSEERLRQYVEQQELVLNVTRRIAGNVGLDEMIPHILHSADRALRADGVRLLLTEPGVRWRAFATGERAGVMAQADARLLAYVTGHGEAELSRVAGDGPLLDELGVSSELACLIALPLVAHQTQHGILWLGFQQPHAFGSADRVFLSILAGQVAIAIANARSFEAARKRREWLSAILASTPDPVLVVDREMCLQLVNPAALELVAALSEESIGQPLDQVVGAEDLVQLLHDFGNGDAHNLEYAAENGYTYSPSISDVRTESGEMAGWVLVLRNITHFKRLNDNMSEFLSTVSHDMRSPLTFMKGYLDMLGMVGELNEKQDGFVDKIAIGVVQMSDMVEKILDAGKIDPVAGTYELSREPSDIVQMFNDVMSRLAEPAAKQGLELTGTISGAVPILNVDQALLTSAFTNLVENAVKYTPEGGHIEVTLNVQDNNLVLRVTDDGYGISAENQKKLFQRNVRVHRKEWKRVKGSGLGLFIVKNVAQRHGGDAWVKSKEGEGSTFTIVIPLAGENMVVAETAAETPE
ncbi:MAG: GAF domain-containing protein [Anaerolineae bacterium]|nr:GAF domain-containing protein [Anaerolineae bacterium]